MVLKMNDNSKYSKDNCQWCAIRLDLLWFKSLLDDCAKSHVSQLSVYQYKKNEVKKTNRSLH